MKIFLYASSIIAGGWLLVCLWNIRKKNQAAQEKEAARKDKEKKAAEQALSDLARNECGALLNFYGFAYLSHITEAVKVHEMEVLFVLLRFLDEEPQWLNIVRELYCPHDKSLIGEYSGPLPESVICKQGQVHTEDDLLFRYKIVKIPAGESILEQMIKLERERQGRQ